MTLETYKGSDITAYWPSDEIVNGSPPSFGGYITIPELVKISWTWAR